MPDIVAFDEPPKIASESPVRALSSFCVNPKGISFQKQEESETILLFLRAHFITNFSWIFIGTILLLAPPLLWTAVSGALQISLLSSFSITPYVLLYYLVVFIYLVTKFTHWFYNIALVTNSRIVDIDFANIAYHDVAITKASMIEDVHYIQPGFFAGLFDYGDLFVQTAADKPNFEAYTIPHPQHASNIIASLIGKNRIH